jgi:hypothetical protein
VRRAPRFAPEMLLDGRWLRTARTWRADLGQSSRKARRVTLDSRGRGPCGPRPMFGHRLWRAVACAAASMPTALPDTTRTSARTSALAISDAKAIASSLALRDPTRATARSASSDPPCQPIDGGALASPTTRDGQRGSSRVRLTCDATPAHSDGRVSELPERERHFPFFGAFFEKS